jgi:hypothetical protein
MSTIASSIIRRSRTSAKLGKSLIAPIPAFCPLSPGLPQAGAYHLRSRDITRPSKGAESVGSRSSWFAIYFEARGQARLPRQNAKLD